MAKESAPMTAAAGRQLSSRPSTNRVAPPLHTPRYNQFGRFLSEAIESAPEAGTPQKAAATASADPVLTLLGSQLEAELTATCLAWKAGQAKEYFTSQATAGRIGAFTRRVMDALPDEQRQAVEKDLGRTLDQARDRALNQAQGKAGSRPVQVLEEVCNLCAKGGAVGDIGPGVQLGLKGLFRKGPPRALSGASFKKVI